MDHQFLCSIFTTIDFMRQYGLSEVNIACIIADIRSAAIAEERMRVNKLMINNPPTHVSFSDVCKLIDTHFPRETIEKSS